MSFPRRTFLAGSALSVAAITAAPTQAQASSASAGNVFRHGVASGDPLPNSVILWTRVTLNDDALPGSTLGEDVQVTWEIARDEAMGSMVKSGTVTASAAHDHTVHVDPYGLEPSTVYFYRFSALGETSPVGRTKTAPAFEADVAQLNIAVASCANYESGFFSAYADMAARARAGEIDVVTFLGDYIYEYATGEYAGKKGVARMHHPEWEILTLEDYRIRYGRYRTDEHLQAAHAAAPWIVVWDDHETANNSWREGAENHTEGVEGDWISRRNAAMQAYFEWLPVRATSPGEGGHIYRSLSFGNLIDLTVLDLRTYRDQETTIAHFADGARTMLGQEQFEWLRGQVATSSAQWNVLANSVMMAPMKLFTIGTPETQEAMTWISQRSTGIAVNSDQWDGYVADRNRLLDVLLSDGANVLFLTGDIHSEWANEINHGAVNVGCEMVCTSISAPNVDEILTTHTGIYHREDNSTSHAVEKVITDANPWVNHLDFDAHGYSIARVRPDEVDMEYYRVRDVEEDNSPVHLAVAKTWRVGEGFVR